MEPQAHCFIIFYLFYVLLYKEHKERPKAWNFCRSEIQTKYEKQLVQQYRI